MNTWVLYLLLLKATVVSFSGFASVPVVREDLVSSRAVLSDEQLNNAIAISQASPGPLGLYIVLVGFFVAGIPGAIAGVGARIASDSSRADLPCCPARSGCSHSWSL